MLPLNITFDMTRAIAWVDGLVYINTKDEKKHKRGGTLTKTLKNLAKPKIG